MQGIDLTLDQTFPRRVFGLPAAEHDAREPARPGQRDESHGGGDAATQRRDADHASVRTKALRDPGQRLGGR
jgi:hypothetical protein